MTEHEAGSIDVTWDSETGILHVSLVGAVRWPRISDALAEAIRANPVPAPIDMLWDCRKMRFSEVTIDRLRTAATDRAKWIERVGAGNVAYVVASNADAQIVSLFNAVTLVDDPRTKRTFHSADEAERWLLCLRNAPR